MDSKMLKFIGIAVAAALVLGMWGGMAWWKFESKKAPAEPTTVAAEVTTVPTTAEPAPEVLTPAAPAKTYSATEYSTVWATYWKYIDDGDLDELLETRPEVQWHGQPLSAAKGENPVGFSTFDDIDKDGMNELLICDGSYAAEESDWRTVLVFKYDPETEEVRFCGGLYGYGTLQLLGDNGLLVNCEAEGEGYYGFYALENYQLVKRFSLVTKGDGSTDYTLHVEDTDKGWTVKKDAYLNGVTDITFQTELAEDDLAMYDAMF